jgi:hypothetical protein
MKQKTTPLVDEHLQAFAGMQETGTDDFFYTRLKARMENRPQAGWNLPLKPVWIVGTLALFLAINSFMLVQQFKTNKHSITSSASLQNFARSYDQDISSSY